MLAAFREPQRTIVLLGLYMGLRIGAEALTLKKENVDLENGLLTIEAGYSKNGKTQTMPIHSCLIEPLRMRIAESTTDYLSHVQPLKLLGRSRRTFSDTPSHPASP